MKPYLRFEHCRVQILAHTLKNSNESYRRGPGRGKHGCGGPRFTSAALFPVPRLSLGYPPEPATSHSGLSSLLPTPSHPNPLAIFNSPRIRGFQRHHFVHFVAYVASWGSQWRVCSWLPFRGSALCDLIPSCSASHPALFSLPLAPKFLLPQGLCTSFAFTIAPGLLEHSFC